MAPGVVPPDGGAPGIGANVTGARTPAWSNASFTRSRMTRCRPHCWLGWVFAMTRMVTVVPVICSTPATSRW